MYAVTGVHKGHLSKMTVWWRCLDFLNRTGRNILMITVRKCIKEKPGIELYIRIRITVAINVAIIKFNF